MAAILCAVIPTIWEELRHCCCCESSDDPEVLVRKLLFEPPSMLWYPTLKHVLYIGELVDTVPLFAGKAILFDCSPLPLGLNLCVRSGTISGMVEPQPLRVWEILVTTRNKQGCTSRQLRLGIVDADVEQGDIHDEEVCHVLDDSVRRRSDVATANVGPLTLAHLSYPEARAHYAVGEQITLEPVYDGHVQRFEVSPLLPEGLKLNASTGVISGASTSFAADDVYHVTALNGESRATAHVAFGVRRLAAKGKVEQASTAGNEAAKGKSVPVVTFGKEVVEGKNVPVLAVRTEVAKGRLGSGLTDGEVATGRLGSGLTDGEVAKGRLGSGLTDGEGHLVTPTATLNTWGHLITPTASFNSGGHLITPTATLNSWAAPGDHDRGSNCGSEDSADPEVTPEVQLSATYGTPTVRPVSLKIPKHSSALHTGHEEHMLAVVQRCDENDPLLKDIDFNSLRMPNSSEDVHGNIAHRLMLSLDHNTYVETLNLSSCGLEDCEASRLGTSLRLNEAVKYLDISHNQLNGDVLVDIAEGIRDNENSAVQTLLVVQRSNDSLESHVQKACAKLLEARPGITKIGMRFSDPHWNMVAMKALQRNCDAARRKQERLHAEEVLEDVPVELALDRMVVDLLHAPRRPQTDFFSCENTGDLVFRRFMARSSHLPDAPMLRNAPSSLGFQGISNGNANAIIAACTIDSLQAAIGTRVRIHGQLRPKFREVEFEGRLLRCQPWGVFGLSFGLRGDNGEKFNLRSEGPPRFVFSPEWQEWFATD